MRKLFLILTTSLMAVANLTFADEVYEIKVDQGANAIWIINKETGQVKMCRSVNNNTLIICSPWSTD